MLLLVMLTIDHAEGQNLLSYKAGQEFQLFRIEQIVSRTDLFPGILLLLNLI